MSKLSPEQALALKLLTQGISTKEIAQRLGVTQRTIERWAKKPEFVQTFERASQNIISQVSNDLVTQAQTKVGEHSEAHQLGIDLALLGLKKLKEKLDTNADIESLDLRRANWLSQILCRHVEGQRLSMGLGFLDINLAAARLEREGYIILDPSANNSEEEDDEEEDS